MSYLPALVTRRHPSIITKSMVLLIKPAKTGHEIVLFVLEGRTLKCPRRRITETNTTYESQGKNGHYFDYCDGRAFRNHP